MSIQETRPNFSDTGVAFDCKSDRELLQTARIFHLMSYPFLVRWGGQAAILAVRMRLPFVRKLIKATIYKQFCGGEDLAEARSTIDHLYTYGVKTMLDFGAEGKNNEGAFDEVIKENLKSIDFGAKEPSVKVISMKVSGLTRNDILEKVQRGATLSGADAEKYKALKKRLHKVCNYAEKRNVGVFFDAEESWIQDAIDELVMELMVHYNRGTIIVYNTYQMYRKDMLDNLKRDHQKAVQDGFILGAKLVRGAYMEQERARAEKRGYESPIHETKADTDQMYNDGIRYCVENYRELAFANATHNLESTQLQVELMDQNEIPRDHLHFNFCQLMGMSDHLTFNLASAGFNVAKYVPYGPVKHVVPYLVRRAHENTSMTGDMGREYKMILEELQRRGLR